MNFHTLDYLLSQIKINISHFEKTALNKFITARGRANAVRKLKKLSILKNRIEQQISGLKQINPNVN